MAGENLNLPVRRYEKQYRGMLQTVFSATNAFQGAIAPIQILDGVQNNTSAFSVKTNNTPVVVGEYKTDKDVAFGTGTSNSSRFGQMTEVIYQDTDVPYDYTLAINEGIDRFTVNNDLNAAIADRLRLQSEAQTRKMNKRIGEYASKVAGKEETLASHEEKAIKDLFNKINTYYVDLEVTAPATAYVKSDLYNAIVDMAQVSKGKGSSVNIDKNGLAYYKDIALQPVAAQYFEENTQAIVMPNGLIIPFVGINTARTITAVDFDGVILQAAAKGGQFILEDNKKAVIKVTGTSTVPGP